LNNVAKWNKNRVKDMDKWEEREFLSYYVFSQHKAESEIDNILKFSNPKVLKIEIRELFANFEGIIKKIIDYCDLKLVRNDFDKIFNMWEPLQIHQRKDMIVDKIIDSVIFDNYYDWTNENLTLLDESIVQMKLRDLHNLELKCYNLNVFPKNTLDLKKLLFNDKSI